MKVSRSSLGSRPPRPPHISLAFLWKYGQFRWFNAGSLQWCIHFHGLYRGFIAMNREPKESLHCLNCESTLSPKSAIHVGNGVSSSRMSAPPVAVSGTPSIRDDESSSYRRLSRRPPATKQPYRMSLGSRRPFPIIAWEIKRPDFDGQRSRALSCESGHRQVTVRPSKMRNFMTKPFSLQQWLASLH